MKLQRTWLLGAILPLGIAIYWLMAIRPFIRIDQAHLAASVLDVRSDISGTLSHFNPSSWVEQGDILFSFNTREEATDLAQLESNLDALQQALSLHLTEAETAMQEYLTARSEEAIGLENSTEQPLTRLGQEQRLAEECKKEMASIREEIESVKQAAERKSFPSPASGFVLERKRATGEKILAGEAVCSLCNPKELWVEALVPESAVSKIKLGQKAVAALPSDSSLRAEGEISWISPIAFPKHEGIPVRIALKEGYPDCFRPNLQVQLTLKVR